MAENKYICQSCFHKGMCLEYDDECYGCPHYVNTADVAPRAEVALEVIDEIQRTIDANAKVGLSSALILAAINNKLVFLKQKYTEEQK